MLWHELLVAVRAVLDAEWTAAPLAYQNEGYIAPTGTPWGYVEVLPIAGTTTLFGSTGLRIAEADGLIAGHIFVPYGTGAGTAMELADQLGALLSLRNIAAGVVTEGYELSGATSGDDEGNFFRVGVTIPVCIHRNV